MSEIVGDSLTAVRTIHKLNCVRNVSGELDVFEATRYFSDFNEPTTLEYSRISIQKQSIVTEPRQNRVHPETEDKLPEPRVVIKPQEITRGGGRKFTSFLNSLLRSTGLKKSKSKSSPEVETPRGKRRRRKSCVVTVTTHAETYSSISGAGAWRLNARRGSFDEKHFKDWKQSDQKSNMRCCESLCSEEKIKRKDGNAGDDDANGEWDTGSESDLFELDLFAKSNS